MPAFLCLFSFKKDALNVFCSFYICYEFVCVIMFFILFVCLIFNDFPFRVVEFGKECVCIFGSVVDFCQT